MSSKEDILKKYRANIHERFDMPDLSDIQAITYSDPLLQFMNMTKSVGGNAIEVEKGRDINELIRELYPDAKEIASNLPEIIIATRNPDEVGRARDLNGTDIGIIRGEFGVAENACDMHEAYTRLSSGKTAGHTNSFEEYGYGTFISGPSKTADIAQVLVMGAQAARSATVLLLDE